MDLPLALNNLSFSNPIHNDNNNPRPDTIVNLIRLSLATLVRSFPTSKLYINKPVNNIDKTIVTGNLSKLFLVFRIVAFARSINFI